MRLLLLLLLSLAAASPAQAAADVVGNWVTQDRSGLVAISRCGKGLCGRVAKALIIKPGYPQTDVNNPDPALRKRPILGLQILSGFSAKGNRWEGKIYDPESGKTYRSVLKLNPDGSLKVSGCISIFCQSQRWTRAR